MHKKLWSNFWKKKCSLKISKVKKSWTSGIHEFYVYKIYLSFLKLGDNLLSFLLSVMKCIQLRFVSWNLLRSTIEFVFHCMGLLGYLNECRWNDGLKVIWTVQILSTLLQENQINEKLFKHLFHDIYFHFHTFNIRCKFKVI